MSAHAALPNTGSRRSPAVRVVQEFAFPPLKCLTRCLLPTVQCLLLRPRRTPLTPLPTWGWAWAERSGPCRYSMRPKRTTKRPGRCVCGPLHLDSVADPAAGRSRMSKSRKGWSLRRMKSTLLVLTIWPKLTVASTARRRNSCLRCRAVQGIKESRRNTSMRLPC